MNPAQKLLLIPIDKQPSLTGSYNLGVLDGLGNMTGNTRTSKRGNALRKPKD